MKKFFLILGSLSLCICHSMAQVDTLTTVAQDSVALVQMAEEVPPVPTFKDEQGREMILTYAEVSDHERWNLRIQGKDSLLVKPDSSIWVIISGEFAGIHYFSYQAAKEFTRAMGVTIPTHKQFEKWWLHDGLRPAKTGYISSQKKLVGYGKVFFVWADGPKLFRGDKDYLDDLEDPVYMKKVSPETNVFNHQNRQPDKEGYLPIMVMVTK